MSVNRSERFFRLSGDDVAIPMCPIAQTVVIIRRSFVCHATFLHHASGSGILSFTFRVDQRLILTVSEPACLDTRSVF
jgi:hypothetical protein